MAPRGLLPLLAAGNFIVVGSAWIVVGILPLIEAEFMLSPLRSASVISAFTLTYAAIAPFTGLLAAKIGYRNLLIGAMALTALSAMCMMFAKGFGTLMVARTLLALGAASFTPIAATVAVSLFPAEQRGRVLSVLYFGIPMAQVAGIPLGTFLAYRVGWHQIYVAIAVLAGLHLIAQLALTRGIQREIAAPGLSLLVRAMRAPDVRRILLLTLVVSTSCSLFYTFTARILEERGGLAGETTAYALTVLGLGVLAGSVATGMLLDRLGGGRMMLFELAVGAVVLPWLTLASYPAGVAFGFTFILGMTMFAHIPPLQAMLTQVAPAEGAFMFGLVSTMIFLGAALGALSGGYLIQTVGLVVLGPAASVMAILAIGITWQVRRRMTALP